MSLEPGARFGSYEVVSKLGEGGMGEVYLARDTTLNRDVAVKVLPELFARDADRLARFKREAQVLAALNHPNIAHIYGLESAGAVQALVMEFVEGEDLSQRLLSGPMPLEDVVAAAGQIADALEAAHEQGIVHRDLKPANVKARPDGTVKVLDFGLAKAIDPASTTAGLSDSMSPTLTARATQIGTIIGTAAYMSPEQAKGKSVDRRADVWAFGVVLYEMLSGQRAFKGEDVSDTLAAVLRHDVDLDALPARTPASIRTLIERCLVRDPRQRLRDIGEARVLLERLRHGTTSDDKAPGSAPAASVQSSRPLWRRALVPAVVTVLVAGAAAYAAWTFKPQPTRPVSRFALVLPEDQTFSNTGRRLLDVSSDGSLLAYVANLRLFVRPIGELQAHAVPGGEGGTNGLTYPTFSPDGQWIAYRTSSDSTLKKLPVAGGSPTPICQAESLYGLSWTEQGLFFGQAGKGIVRVSADGGVPEVVAAVGPDEMVDAPSLLPGGRTVLFSVKKSTDPWDKGQVVAQTLGRDDRKVLIDGGADARYVSTGHLVYAVQGVLFARPFDPGSLSLTSGPVAIVEGVRRSSSTATSTASAHYAFSATGSLAYVPGPQRIDTVGASDLAIFDSKGQGQSLKLPPADYRAPRVSPDGSAVAVEVATDATTDVFIYELSGKTAIRRLTFDGKSRAPVWSPDSRSIVFESERDGDDAIFRQAADGSGAAERLTKPESGARHIPQTWSPDGRVLLYTQFKDGRSSLWQLSLGDRQVSPFAGVESSLLTEASFSPDGKWVAYTAYSSESRASYVIPFPPTGAKYQVPSNGGHVFWSPKGDKLTMNVNPGLSATVAVTTRPQFGFGPPERYSRTGRSENNPATSRRNADAMPDGRILGVTMASPTDGTAATASQITIVLNWFEEIQRRVR